MMLTTPFTVRCVLCDVDHTHHCEVCVLRDCLLCFVVVYYPLKPMYLHVSLLQRQLEAIVRISESLAKMAMLPFATEVHVDEALRLFQVSTLEAAQSGKLAGEHTQCCPVCTYCVMYVCSTVCTLNMYNCM